MSRPRIVTPAVCVLTMQSPGDTTWTTLVTLETRGGRPHQPMLQITCQLGVIQESYRMEERFTAILKQLELQARREGSQGSPNHPAPHRTGCTDLPPRQAVTPASPTRLQPEPRCQPSSDPCLPPQGVGPNPKCRRGSPRSSLRVLSLRPLLLCPPTLQTH